MPGDRTEQASPRARQKAAEHGDRARSRDLMAGAAMLAGLTAVASSLLAFGNAVALMAFCDAYRFEVSAAPLSGSALVGWSSG